jgi:O-6-methylguanine DNA methyltransferase
MYCMVIHHSLTEVSLLLDEQIDFPPKIFALIFGAKAPGPFRPIPVAWLKQVTSYAGQIIAFLDGRQQTLDQLPLDMQRCSSFQKSIFQACCRVPWGSVISYARLAQDAGHPGAARAAASAMRNNPFPLIIPCHRIIRSNGAIGGFAGEESGKKIVLKRKLLENEGISA